MYADDDRFRATIDMRRYRFSEGEDRYFEAPYPKPIEALKQALYPRLLPIARDWWQRLGRAAPWPTPSTTGSKCATPRDSRGQRPFCFDIAQATGMLCIETSTATWCSHCRL
jgi:hypothetical protein